jgi:hypothetical protein
MLLTVITIGWSPQLTPSVARSCVRSTELAASELLDDRGKVLSGAAVAVTATLAATTIGINGVFGVLDNTADELADILGIDDVPPAAASVVQALRPVYAPLKAVTPSCTAALFPEFNEMVRAARASSNNCLANMMSTHTHTHTHTQTHTHTLHNHAPCLSTSA